MPHAAGRDGNQIPEHGRGEEQGEAQIHPEVGEAAIEVVETAPEQAGRHRESGHARGKPPDAVQVVPERAAKDREFDYLNGDADRAAGVNERASQRGNDQGQTDGR